MDKFKSAEHQEITIGEEKIYFPYAPYKQQEEFIRTMYSALENKENCLLESPTGTGKTLSILTAALGWLFNQHQKKWNGDCKILYASRTHSQIKQLVKELKATSYNPIISLLGSRDQLCVNSDLNDVYGSEKNNKCSLLTKIKGCSYFENLEKIRKKAVSVYSRKVMDIEDLVRSKVPGLILGQRGRA